MNAEAEGGLMSVRRVSLAATFGSLLPWMTMGVSDESRDPWASLGIKEAAASALERDEVAVAALRFSERLLRQLFDDAPISMAVFEPAGRLVHFNRAFGVMLGYPAENLRERKLEELVHPDDVRPIQERRRMLIEGRCEGFEVAARFATANRHDVWTRLNGRLQRAGGERPPHIFAHIVELPELKHPPESVRGQAEDMLLKNWDPERYL